MSLTTAPAAKSKIGRLFHSEAAIAANAKRRGRDAAATRYYQREMRKLLASLPAGE